MWTARCQATWRSFIEWSRDFFNPRIIFKALWVLFLNAEAKRRTFSRDKYGNARARIPLRSTSWERNLNWFVFYNIRTKKIEFLGTYSSYGYVRFFRKMTSWLVYFCLYGILEWIPLKLAHQKIWESVFHRFPWTQYSRWIWVSTSFISIHSKTVLVLTYFSHTFSPLWVSNAVNKKALNSSFLMQDIFQGV